MSIKRRHRNEPAARLVIKFVKAYLGADVSSYHNRVTAKIKRYTGKVNTTMISVNRLQQRKTKQELQRQMNDNLTQLKTTIFKSYDLSTKYSTILKQH